MPRLTLVFAVGVLAATLSSPSPRAQVPPSVRSPSAGELQALARSADPLTGTVRILDGANYLGVNDLARLLGATKFWHPAVRKLELRAADHRIQLTVDNPFVVIDDSTVWVSVPVRSKDGELQVPVALIDHLPRDATIPRLVLHPSRGLVFKVPEAGVVGSPTLDHEDRVTRIVVPAEQPTSARVVGRSRAHFRLKLDGLFVGDLPALRIGSLVDSMAFRPATRGFVFELRVAARAVGFRLIREPERKRLVLELSSQAGPGFESFAPESPPGPRMLRVVVLDPGHGGEDLGVALPEGAEKDLTLALARQLRAEIERRLRARVVLTRDEDVGLVQQARAERANLARADVVISLHFDGLASRDARGATAYCPPAVFGFSPSVDLPERVDLLPWRDAATRHAVASRALAEDVLTAIELRAQGPTRLREALPYPLLGVNAPGLLLECGTLSSPADRARLLSEGGLAELAAAITDGLQAYQRKP